MLTLHRKSLFPLMHKTTHPCVRTYPPPFQTPPPKNDVVFHPILQPYSNRHEYYDSVSPPFMVTAATAATSWLRNRRIRFFFLLLCSPLLLVLLCVAFPFLCFVELCLRRRIWRKFLLRDSSGEDGGDRLRRCEEGCCGCDGDAEEKGLLHRYLEDQLFLVGSMYECGDDEEQEEEEDSRTVLDVENLGSGRIPLLR